MEYKINEEDLYRFLKYIRYQDLELSKEDTSRYDCISHENTIIIELKCRKTHYDTLRLEKLKYDAMIEIADEMLYIPLYINETPKGIYSFNLYEIEPKWTYQYNPKTTSFSNKQMIKKLVYDIPITDAEIIATKN